MTITSRLVKLDLNLTERIQLQSPAQPLWKLAALIAHTGDSWVWAICVGLIWLLRLGDQSWHWYAAILEASVVGQALFVFGLKRFFKRERPQGDWGGIYRQIDPHSFPSGHATRAFMLLVLAFALGPAWMGWVIAVWAPLVCLARVMTGVHYVSDILGGAVLGLILGAVMVGIYPLILGWFPFLINLP